MKKLYTALVAVFAITQYSYAQNSDPWPTSGNVGIGTANPGTHKLAVFGDSGFNAGYFLGANTYNNSFGLTVQAGTTSADIAMQVVNRSFGTPYFFVRGDGNVGIGTTTASQKLTVLMDASTNGTGVAVQGINSGGAGSQPGFALLNPSSVMRMNSYLDISSDTYNIGNAVGAPLMTINQSGYVGIGTTTPGQKLTVLMDASINGTGVAVQAINTGGAGSQPGFALLNPSSVMRMNSYLDISSDTYNIGNAVGAALMTINQSGYVGIGTTTPHEALSVNGNIRSKQIKVETNNWPDYVFKPGYNLPSLTEVKTYLDKYQHLPDMPAAAEVAKDGLNLGEINKSLTKKVEELTLYLIDQHKQINELKQQVEAITKALNKK